MVAGPPVRTQITAQGSKGKFLIGLGCVRKCCLLPYLGAARLAARLSGGRVQEVSSPP